MKFGIVGAANIGATISASGHESKLANSKESDSLQVLARSVGVRSINSKSR